MEAGRNLDALIAEKVMGYRLLWAHKVWSMEDWLTTDYPTEQNTMAIVTDESWEPGKSYPKHLIIPPYSTDIVEAWAVVEKMSADGWGYEIHDHYAITVRFGRGEYDHWGGMWSGGDVSAFADTAPLAICLASLKAVGVS